MAFVILPIIILGMVSYQISSSALKEKVGRETLQTLQGIDLTLQMVVSEVNSFSDYVIASSDIHNFLKANDEQSLVDFYNNSQAIAGLLYGQSKIDDLILYNPQGETYHFKKGSLPPYNQFQETAYYHLLLQGKGRPVWLSSIEHDGIITDSTPLMTHGRVIKDPNTLNNIGFLILKIKMDRVDEVFQNVHQEDSIEMIVNQDGKIVYGRDHQLIGGTLDLKKSSVIFPGGNGTVIDQWKGEKSLVTFIPVNEANFALSDFYLVSIKPWKVLSEETKYIRHTTIYLVLIGIVLAIIFNFLFLRRIIKFINEFQKSMKLVEKGDLSARMSTFVIQELRNLANGFNSMINQITVLLDSVKNEQERKRQAEFKVLQNQINPHFLYNTLESINALAALNEQKDISKMTVNLGKLLRISIDATDEVRVADEVRHVKSYMEIQKVRFDEHFAFEVNVDERLNNYFVLKLVLQPLVENILNHAFDREQEDAVISITGEVCGERGCFYISDNGKGIDDDVLRAFNDQNNEDKSGKIGHGFMNVHERLRIYYGEKAGLTIFNIVLLNVCGFSLL